MQQPGEGRVSCCPVPLMDHKKASADPDNYLAHTHRVSTSDLSCQETRRSSGLQMVSAVMPGWPESHLIIGVGCHKTRAGMREYEKEEKTEFSCPSIFLKITENL